MTGKTGKQRRKLKTFEVAYCVEQGFSIIVNAASAELAEEIVEQRLDDECDVLEGSTRVHYDGFVASSGEVKP
jgi:predicted dinucleotide-utilizing enzyme